jgi:hypothetical protein
MQVLGGGGRHAHIRQLVQRLLVDHIDAIRFHDIVDPPCGAGPADGDAGGAGSTGQTLAVPITMVVPVTMPEWTGALLWQLASRHDAANDLWLSFLTSSQHRLQQVALPHVPPVSVGCWRGRGEATRASIGLFFELERQQELVRRKIASLERLMHCKLFVGQVDSFTARLQKHAEQLFSGIRIKQETPNTLDTLCSQLARQALKSPHIVGLFLPL